LDHNFGSGPARRSIKGSKDADDRLVSKKSQKMAHWIGAQDQLKWVKNSKNMSPL